MTRIYAGTSGFAYREWRGSFYPPDLAVGKMLSFYAARFPAVEINATFYRMPGKRLMEQWLGQVPEGFLFSLKAPGLITHRKKLVNVDREIAAFLEAAAVLGLHLGPLLFQLPPGLSLDLPLLENCLALVEGTKAAFEFRHPSWFLDETYRLLMKFGCALCVSSREDFPDPRVVATSRFGYLRLRRDDYDRPALVVWREKIEAQGWEEAFVFFRHEETGKGPLLATLFREL